jgi:hypothetical protein
VHAILAGEKCASLSFNLGDRSITKLDRADDMGVELGEDIFGLRHMVCSTTVEDPPIVVLTLRGAQVCIDPLLIDVDGGGARLQLRQGPRMRTH